MALDLIIRNGTLVTPTGQHEADIGVRDGRFVAIEPRGALREPAAEDVDATGLHVLPGVIDGHVHFREPGLELQETWLTGTRAAVMGGVTTALDMPNNLPPTDTVERAHAKLALAARSAYCDFGTFGLVGPSGASVADLVGTGLLVGLKVFLGPTTGGLSAPGDDGLRTALTSAREASMRVAFHAEDRSVIAARETGLRAALRTDVGAHLESRPPDAEVTAIDHAARLLHETDAAGHVLHLSSADGLAAVAAWRARGCDLTCETTPHHALLDKDVYDRFGGVAKANPPLRGGGHASALVEALADGRIDCLASDHAPHLLADKQRESIWDVPAGIPGVETLLPLMLSEVAAGRLTLERLVALTAEGPARTWNLWPRKGTVSAGADADLTLVNLQRRGVIRAAELHGKNNVTPFEGWPTRGAPVATIVRGRVVMRDGELLVEPGWGQAVTRRSS